MKSDVALRLRESAAAFVSVVWPKVKGLCQEGDLIPCESAMARELALDLDLYSGIDAWQIIREKSRVRGIASRVQPVPDGQVPFDTFTIRYSRPSGAATEFAKRVAALATRDEGWLLPHLTIHAYTDQPATRLLSAAVARTADLFGYLLEHERDDDRRTVYRRSTPDGTVFLVAPWANLRRDGVRVRVV